jgi:tetratricopeptide (TPR) repeat protein
VVQNLELATLAGGRQKVISPKAKVNVFVFFRANHERSLDALKQMAACERELAGKPIAWAAIVSSAEPVADVKAAVAESGIRMPVLIDENDAFYDALDIRMHPMVGVVDARAVLSVLEPYRQIEYCEVIKARIRVVLGETTVAAADKAGNAQGTGLPGSDPMKKAMRDVNMARKLIEIGEYEEAVKFSQKALQVAPVAEAYTVMGQAYAKLRKCPDAEKAFAMALKLDPFDKGAAAARGSCN